MEMDIDYGFEKRSRGGMTDVLENAKRRKLAADAQYVATLQAMPKGGGYTRSKFGNPIARKGYTTVPRTMGVYATGEMKYFESELAETTLPASVNWAGTELDPVAIPVAGINTLFCPTLGAGINQRIGKSCKVIKIKIRGMLTVNKFANQVAGKNAAGIRLLLVQDNQTNATQAQGEEVLQAPVTANVGSALCSWQNINNFGRFRVLKDKFYRMEDPNGFFDGTNIEINGLIRNFKWTVTFRDPQEVRFNAVNGGTIADIVNTSWHIIGNVNSQDLAPTIKYQCRVCFKE